MVKKLIKHGNSLALVIDKPVLDLLKITEDTPLEIETLDGKSLQIKPLSGATESRPSVKDALERTNKKFAKTLRNLAK
jgi:antitoxin component of MazEF toxin-antitoxin module